MVYYMEQNMVTGNFEVYNGVDLIRAFDNLEKAKRYLKVLKSPEYNKIVRYYPLEIERILNIII